MPPTERDLDAYECSSCGSIVVNEESTCCGEPTDAVDGTAKFEPPELELVVREIFGISSTELTVCRAVMVEGEATVKELTAQIDRDRSVIMRHLNHLTELGVVEKHSRVLKEGGRVNVYSPLPPDDVRRQLKLGLYAWVDDAMEHVEELNQEKIEAMAERQAEPEADESTSRATEDANETEPVAEAPESETRGSLVARLFGRDRSP